MKKLFLIFFMFNTDFCFAEGISEPIRQEIAHLISYLENSGCQFNRNGSWHSAKDAGAHINKKYQYLLDKNLVATAEEFIARAASESSMSGKPYEVKCADSAAVASAQWFKAELDQYRKK